ncbi:hypothetical protein NMY22_g19180 [Coprinellus aureogranulatus]|nr:hypothetical protein NMY22_g19180 [Coprinellus aureogranulatus]
MVKRTAELPVDQALRDARPTDIVIPIMGATGAGKSHFINLLLEEIKDRRKVQVGNKLASCTVNLQPIVFENQIESRAYINLNNEYRIVIVDTPGFDDTTASDFEILRRIATWLQESFKRKMVLGGVLYLHSINLNRFSGTARRNLDIFKRLCGEAALDKVVLVTTQWSRGSSAELETREKELKDVHWKDLLGSEDGQGGATVMRLGDREGKGEGGSAWAIVGTVLKKLDQRLSRTMLDDVLQIQEELVKKKKSVKETEAAYELRKQLKEALRIQEELMELEESAADGSEGTEAKIKEKEAQLREMQQAIQRNKITLGSRIGSFFRRILSF